MRNLEPCAKALGNYIYFRPYVVHVPLTRIAQTSDQQVEVQKKKGNIMP